MKSKKKNPLEKFTDEQLYAELNRRQTDTEALQYKTLNLDGFTPKDLVCMQGCEYDWGEEQVGYKDEYGPYYYFYLKVDDKLYDIYYQGCATENYDGRENSNPSRWPKGKDEDSYAALSLVPSGFAEAAENMYEYHGKIDVKKHLKQCGITDFRVWRPELKDEESGIDHNYDFSV